MILSEETCNILSYMIEDNKKMNERAIKKAEQMSKEDPSTTQLSEDTIRIAKTNIRNLGIVVRELETCGCHFDKYKTNI